MVRKHSRDEILGAALTVAFRDGLSALSFGKVAKEIDTSDRMIVYYFASKDELVGNVILAMGEQVQAVLGAAFAAPASTHLDLVRAAWPLLTGDDVDRTFALFFEANGLAAAGHEPFASVVPQLVAAWIEWTIGFLEGDDEFRRSEAEAAVAIVDGLLLLRQLAGPDAAERAAERLGVLG